MSNLLSNRIAVLGAGSFGTALAQVLAENGQNVRLYARRSEIALRIESTRVNSDYLPNLVLSDKIRVSSEMSVVLADVDHVLLAVPSSSFRGTIQEAAEFIKPDMRICHATKGFDESGLKRMTEVLAEELPHHDTSLFAVLTGPSHAEEVAKRCPTTVVIASSERTTAEGFQDLLMSSYFRVYTNPDVIGAEVAGALKNIIALGCGISDGLGFGDNAKAALMTRGLSEITRLGTAMGASALTFSGLAGVGDLIVTCTSTHSRNWRAGYQLGLGKSLEEILSSMKMVVEGVRTTQAASKLSEKFGVELPIAASINRVLFEGVSPLDAVSSLMSRGRTHEMEDAYGFFCYSKN